MQWWFSIEPMWTNFAEFWTENFIEEDEFENVVIDQAWLKI